MLCSAQAPASSDDDADSDDGARPGKRARPVSAKGNVDYRKKRSNKPASAMKGLRKK